MDDIRPHIYRTHDFGKTWTSISSGISASAYVHVVRTDTQRQGLLFAGTERVRRGDFTHKIAIRAKDQLGELAHSFNSMTASIENLLRCFFPQEP